MHIAIVGGAGMLGRRLTQRLIKQPLLCHRTLNMPGVSATVEDQIDALSRVAGHEATQLIRPEPDAAIEEMVNGWASGFDPRRALELGFSAEKNFDEIINAHIEDELEGNGHDSTSE